jgi:hypothetical protein
MMMLPAASIGDRKIVSHFDITPKIVRVGQNVLMKIFLVDQNTNQKIIHVTVRMDISKDGKHVLGEFFHSHDALSTSLFVKPVVVSLHLRHILLVQPWMT